MIDHRTTYILNACHVRTLGEKSERQRYRRTYHIDTLEHRKGVLYDPNLKMHFEAPDKDRFLYEIETDNVQVLLCNRLKKAEDFTRRTSYLYDWIQVNVLANGKIQGIKNVEELKTNWSELKSIIQSDYLGTEVNNYLEELTQILDSEQSVMRAFCQYFQFGLLFTGIPVQHKLDWKTIRLIEFSEYEKEQFQEEISLHSLEDGIRTYALTGRNLPESESIIEKYEGWITLPEKEMLVSNAHVEIIYCYEDYRNKWNFNLQKQ